MGRGYPAEQWAEWVAEQAASGPTVAAFCDSIGVSENSFYVWRRKLRAREDEFTTGSRRVKKLNRPRSSMTIECCR